MYKDVEGLSPQLISNMYQNIRFLDPPHNTIKSILPCTPLAVIKILEHLQIYNSILDYGKRLFGRRITVINRSEVVGRPLAALLANDGAEVYSVDVTGVQQFSRGSGLKKVKHESRDMEGWTLEQCLPISDVVISGVPGDSFKVPTHLVRDGAVCVNFSSEKVSQPTFEPQTRPDCYRISIRTSRRKHRYMCPQLARLPLPFCSAICYDLHRIRHKSTGHYKQQLRLTLKAVGCIEDILNRYRSLWSCLQLPSCTKTKRNYLDINQNHSCNGLRSTVLKLNGLDLQDLRLHDMNAY
jgi:methylenetetrahydrofolate dehydrogenase (NAD+)